MRVLSEKQFSLGDLIIAFGVFMILSGISGVVKTYLDYDREMFRLKNNLILENETSNKLDELIIRQKAMSDRLDMIQATR